MITSGSLDIPTHYMEIIAAGRNKDDFPLGALFFEKEGNMKLVLLDKKDSDEVESVMLVADYFEYALARSDWMEEFVNSALSYEEASGNDLFKALQSELGITSGSLKDRVLN